MDVRQAVSIDPGPVVERVDLLRIAWPGCREESESGGAPAGERAVSPASVDTSIDSRGQGFVRSGTPDSGRHAIDDPPAYFVAGIARRC
jgi:hypothetical protein